MSDSSRTTSFFFRAITGLCIIASGVHTSSGQSTFGSITGTVTDPTGSAIPNATVTATNQDTSVSRHASSGGDGVYSITDLLPGAYTVSAVANGFSSLERKGVVLDANRVVNVDAQLTLGSSASKIEVQAVSPVINTETSATSFVKTASELADTPLLAEPQQPWLRRLQSGRQHWQFGRNHGQRNPHARRLQLHRWNCGDGGSGWSGRRSDLAGSR
jgi:hypothetical protein